MQLCEHTAMGLCEHSVGTIQLCSHRAVGLYSCVSISGVTVQLCSHKAVGLCGCVNTEQWDCTVV